ncbi:MAG: hypothetical protein HQL13_02385, partial [Candidatus Omnitrophica bacterium]|nr:hypothetical protein [Candidatus Omnitrophota bacterium]
MEKQVKRSGKDMDPRRSKLIDNPLLQSTIKPAIQGAAPLQSKAAVHSAVRQIKESTKYIT